MKTSIAVLDEALAEANDAIDYLEASRPGLGAAFAAALADAFDRLESHPEIGASAEFANATRRWKLARFPYSIIYVLEPERLVVVAIAHEHRRPGGPDIGGAERIEKRACHALRRADRAGC